jgi:hypothetical protein
VLLLQEAAGPLSVVTLMLFGNSSVLMGDAIYWDTQMHKMRNVMVSNAELD